MKVCESLTRLVNRVARSLQRIGRLLAPEPALARINGFEALESRVLLSSQFVYLDIDTTNATPSTTPASAANVFVAVADGGNVAIDLNYTSLNDAGLTDSTLPALAFRLHYDSTQLTFDAENNVSNVVLSDFLAPLGVEDDTEDLDADASTDKYVQFFWFDLDVGGIVPFPNTDVPTRLATLQFAADANFDGTTINFTDSGTLTEIEDDGDSTPLDEEFTLSAGSITINATDVDYDFDPNGLIDLGDFSFFSNAFFTQPGDGNYDARLDYDGSGLIDLGDFSFFSVNFFKTPNDPTLVYPQPAVQELVLDGQALANGEVGTQPDAAAVEALLDEALAIWDAALPGYGASEQLDDIEIVWADLPGSVLGTAGNGQVTLDINAAGHGWFIDATPGDNVEFELVAGGYWAAVAPEASERVDLLTVLVHELGHELGLGHDTSGVMDAALSTSVRQLPTADQGAHWLEELLADDATPGLVEI